jgi:hypothetical protein
VTNTSAFESIESAQEYLGLLTKVIEEAQQSCEADLRYKENAASPRRMEAVRVVSYNLERLSQHVRSSRRILNDLRTLRRLMHRERHVKAA